MSQTYTATAKWFHWLITFLVGLELLIAFMMTRLRWVASPSMLINIHMSFGVVIITIMFLRLLWRITHRAPQLPKETPVWQMVSAYAVHYLLYALLFLIPIAGWVWANALGLQVTLFGLITLPTLLPTGSLYIQLAAHSHVYLVGLLLVLIAIHMLASLYHWYIKKDDVLEGMLPTDTYTTQILKYLNVLRY